MKKKKEKKSFFLSLSVARLPCEAGGIGFGCVQVVILVGLCRDQLPHLFQLRPPIKQLKGTRKFTLPRLRLQHSVKGYVLVAL